MTPSGTFKIHAVFKLHQRGLVLTGNLLDGNVKSGDFLKMSDNSEPSLLKIISVEYVDHLRNQQAELGLIIESDSQHLLDLIKNLAGTELLVMQDTTADKLF